MNYFVCPFHQVHLVHAKSGKDLGTIDDVSILKFTRDFLIKYFIFAVESIIVYR